MSGSVGELHGGDPIDSTSIQDVAPSLVPSTTGQVLSSTFAQQFSQNPSVGLARVAGMAASRQGETDPETGIQTVAPDPIVPKDDLNKQFGIPGVLSFDKDDTAQNAQILHDHHVAEIQRADIISRAPDSILAGGVARFGSSTAAGLLDPLNIASAFVPGVPEARVAGLLGDAALGAGGRLAVRAATGATQGIAGQAALAPVEYGVARAQQDDWDAGTALSSIAFGGLIGGVLHGGLGAIEDAGHGAPEWARQVQAVPRDLQETIAKGSMAGMAEDAPRPMDQILDLHSQLKDLQSSLEQARAGFGAEPEQPADTTRFFHGYKDDNVPDSGGDRFVVPDATTARDFNTDTPNNVSYVDVPNDHPVLSGSGGLKDDVNNSLRSGQLPEELAKQMQPYPPMTRLDAEGQDARIADLQQKMQDVGQKAEQIASAARTPITDQDIPQQREIAMRAATSPEITGDPVKDMAAIKQHDADFQQFVKQEKDAGRWGDAEDNALQKITERQALGEGDAKAFASAASCIARNMASA
jgi:hypothetical protein